MKNKVKANLISSETVFKGEFVNIRKEKYELPNKKIIDRERIQKNNGKSAVIIISMTSDNKFILVSQNRINELVTIEFPSGYIEKDESIQEAANRELLEETGYIAEEIIFLDSYNNQLGIDSSVVNIVLAKNCVKMNNQNLDSSEYILFDEFDLDELKTLVKERYLNGCGNKLAFYEFINLTTIYKNN